MPTIVTASRFTAAPGRDADLRTLLLELQREIRQEPGTLAYEIHEAVDPTTGALLVTQHFESEQAFLEHGAHMAALDAPRRLADVLDGPLSPPELFVRA